MAKPIKSCSTVKSLQLILFTCLLILSQSCSADKDCDLPCTMDYRTIVIEIKNSEGAPVILDSFKVVDLRNDRDITLQLDDWTRDYQRERGIYPIFSDKYNEEYRQQLFWLRFTGYIENVEVVNEVYKVGADCCHVYHYSGDLELVI